MAINVSPKIVPFLVSKKRYQLLRGGRGGFKSHSAALKMLFGILGLDPYEDENGSLLFRESKSHFRGIISRDTMENIRDGQYQDIVDLIKLYELGDRIVIGKSPYSFYCPATGFNIIAKATRQSRNDATAKAKGIKDPTMIWVDEMPDMEKDHFRKLAMSARKAGSDCQIICTHNTDISSEHWVRQQFYESEREDTFYLHTTYLDNLENLSKGAIADYESMKDYDYDNYLVEVMGHWGSKKVERPFATQYDQKKHFKECYFQQQRTVFLSMDFNLDPFAFTFGHIWQDIDGFHFWIFDEMSIEGGNLPEAVSQIRSKYGAWLHNFVVCGDYNGNNRSMQSASLESNYQMLQRLLNLNSKQMKVKPNPRHKNSRSDCNFLLAHAEDLRIHTNCVSLDADMRLVEVDADEKIIKQDRKKIGQKADLLDAFRYMADTQEVKDWMKIKQSNVNGR
jgi:hypothetical protein